MELVAGECIGPADRRQTRRRAEPERGPRIPMREPTPGTIRKDHEPAHMPSLDVLQQDRDRLKSLSATLHRFTAPAADALVERYPNGDVRCFACGHRCLVKPGRDGVCRVRF